MQATASAAAANQALAAGIAAGHQATAGSASARVAAHWLPVATASGATPVKCFFVKLADQP